MNAKQVADTVVDGVLRNYPTIYVPPAVGVAKYIDWYVAIHICIIEWTIFILRMRTKIHLYRFCFSCPKDILKILPDILSQYK